MTRKIALLAAGITILYLFAPTATASPPTITCYSDYEPNPNAPVLATKAFNSYGFAAALPGELVTAFSITHNAGNNGRDTRTYGVSSSCGTIFNSAFTCPQDVSNGGNAAFCDKFPPKPDPSGQLGILAHTSSLPSGALTFDAFQHITKSLGSLVQGNAIASQVDLLSPAICTGSSFKQVGYFALAQAKILYSVLKFCSSHTWIATVDPDAGTILNSADLGTGLTSIQDMNVDNFMNNPSFAFVTVSAGGTTSAYRISLGTNAISSALGSGIANVPVAGAPLQSYMDSDKVFILRSDGGTIGNPSYGFVKVNKAAWTSAATGTFGAISGHINSQWDLDAADNILACGTDLSSNAHAWLFNTVTPAITYSISITPTDAFGTNLFSSTTCNGAVFDYSNGFFFWGDGTLIANGNGQAGKTGTWIAHFACDATCGVTQGNPNTIFNQASLYPSPDGAIVIPSVNLNATYISAGNAILAFSAGIGFTTRGDQFFFGLILVLAAMAVVFAIMAGISKGKNGKVDGAAMLAATAPALVLGMGEMLFNVLITLWDLWTAAILMVVCAGVLSVLLRKLYGFGGGASG